MHMYMCMYMSLASHSREEQLLRHDHREDQPDLRGLRPLPPPHIRFCRCCLCIDVRAFDKDRHLLRVYIGEDETATLRVRRKGSSKRWLHHRRNERLSERISLYLARAEPNHVGSAARRPDLFAEHAAELERIRPRLFGHERQLHSHGCFWRFVG